MGEAEECLLRYRETLETGFLDSIIENIPDMIFVKDAEDLRFVRFNRAGEELLGYSREELLGKNDYDFFPREEADFFTRNDREVLEGRELVDIPEEPIRTRSKGTRILHTKKIPILDDCGVPIYLLGISEDITDLKHLQEERRQRAEIEKARSALRNLMQSIPDGILVVDGEQRVVEANRAAVELCGIERREELLRPLEELAQYFEPSGPEGLSWEQIAERVSAREWGTCESRIRRSDGTSLEIEIKTSSLEPREGQYAAVLVLRDVTEQKQLESLRDEFFSIAAHELKAPLTTIKGYAQVMRGWSAEDLEQRGGRALEILNRQADRLSRLVQELLEISRLQLGRLELKPATVDLEALVREIVEEAQETCRHHRIELERSTPIETVADRDRIEQVLSNLLSNAINFSPCGQEITVALERRDGEALVSVRDRGIGIPPEARDRVFERFFRAHRRGEHAAPSGLGMGLHISRELVRRHGGDIDFESREGEGSTFYFTLPIVPG